MSKHTEIEAVLRLAALPRPDGEKHDMDPAHDLCLGDDPCICIQLNACEQRFANKIAALLVEEIDWTDGFATGLNAAREAVAALTTDLALSDQDTVVYRADVLAAIDALREKP